MKFLTVLLVIAVMFTFSFGSAFAAAPSSSAYAAAYNEAVDYAITVADAAYDKAVAEGLNVATALNVSAEAWATAKASYLAALKDSISLKSNGDYPDAYSSSAEAILARGMNAESTAYALFGSQNWYSKTTAASYITSQTAIVNKAAKAEFKIKLDAAYDLLANKIDLTAYSGSTLTSVKSAIKGMVRTLDKTVDGGEGWTAYTDSGIGAAEIEIYYIKHVTPGAVGGALETVVPEYWNETVGGVTTNTTGTKYATGLYLLSGYSTDADKAAGKGITDAQNAALKAIVAKNAATYLAIPANQTAAGKKIANAYQTVLNYLIDEEAFTADTAFAGTVAGTGVSFTLDDYTSTVAEIDELKAYAAKYAAERDAEGNLVRDPEDIQDIVDEATLDIYVAKVESLGQPANGYTDPVPPAVPYTLATAKTDIEKTTVKSDAAGFEFDRQVAIEAAKATAEAYADDCYDVEAEQVDAALATAVAAIEAASKASEIEQAQYNFERALKAIKKATAVDAAFDAAPIQTEIAAQATAAQTYIDYVNTGKAAYAADKILYTDLDQIKDMLEDYYIEQGARTVAEVKAMALDAAAIAAMLPTTESKAAALKAAQDAITALPAATKVASADQAAIEAAIALVESAEDAGNTVGAPYTTKLSDCIDTLEGALKTDLLKEYAAADKKDKVALRNLQDKIDAFNELYEEGGVLYENRAAAPFAISGIQTNLDSIKDAEELAVENAIKAIPINVTEADKATVETARKLYDAYVKDWTKYTATAHNAANDIDNFRTLALAEAALGLNAPDPEENAKAYVQDLSIKARSVKTSKGVKITIKADVQQLLDDGFTVEYRFYRSTKSNKNFGKPMIVKSTNTYTNTKGVKGTRYYYKAKIVVKNAAGEVVATTPLTQCLYATRVF